MSFSYADKFTPFVLSPTSLDEHLARGWYRMGGSIFTTHFLFFNRRPYSAVWIRLDLNDFKFSKSQRKLMRRNAALFNVEIGLRDIDAEREKLYTRYAESFDGRLSASISDNLEEYGRESVFNTQSVTVREKISGKLAALSYFDLGDHSTASILGIYDPAMKSCSLGYYTMLLEIEFCLEQGMRYYYPGYVVPGYKRFDYKLRLGTSYCYDLGSETWMPWDENYIGQTGPTEIQELSLNAVLSQLKERGIERELLIYPLFEADLYDVWNDNYLPYPYLIFLGNLPGGDPVVLTFDPRGKQYLVLRCSHTMQATLLFNAGYLSTFSEGPFFTRLLNIHAVLLQTDSLEEVVGLISRSLSDKD